MGGPEGYLYARVSEARCAARSALFITKTSSHHFEIFSSLRDSLIISESSTHHFAIVSSLRWRRMVQMVCDAG